MKQNSSVYCFVFFALIGLSLLAACHLKVKEPLVAGPKAAPADLSGPKISFDELVYDFGVAGQRQEIRHSFTFRNMGTESLVVEKVDTDCGCTAALVSSSRIDPGEQAVLHTVFKTRRYEGSQEKKVYVFSNDPSEPEVELTIKGVVKTMIAILPEGMSFGNVNRGEHITRQVKVYQVEAMPLKISKVEADHRYLDVDLARFEEENSQGFEVKATLLSENLPVGPLAEVITLHTNVKGRPRVDVPVWARILGRIKTEPGMLSFGVIKKGMGGSAEARIFRHDGEEFGVVRAESNLPYLAVEVKELVRRKEYAVTVHVQKNSPAGRMAGEIRIFTDDQEEAVVKLPCFALIEK